MRIYRKTNYKTNLILKITFCIYLIMYCLLQCETQEGRHGRKMKSTCLKFRCLMFVFFDNSEKQSYLGGGGILYINLMFNKSVFSLTSVFFFFLLLLHFCCFSPRTCLSPRVKSRSLRMREIINRK